MQSNHYEMEHALGMSGLLPLEHAIQSVYQDRALPMELEHI